MSLEDRIAANTEALIALTIALAANHVPMKATDIGPAATGTAPAKPAAKPAATPPGGAPALDYETDVKPLALRVAKEKKREGLVAILDTFKVAQANLLKPEQWAAFIAACNKALAA